MAIRLYVSHRRNHMTAAEIVHSRDSVLRKRITTLNTMKKLALEHDKDVSLIDAEFALIRTETDRRKAAGNWTGK